MSLESKVPLLKKRSNLIQSSREFFMEKGLMEVDCFALHPYPTIDLYIDPIEIVEEEGRWFLHTSPEYKMKRLLSAGMDDIFQISHVYRKGESSLKHHIEFTMVEWYRKGFTLDQMIHETLAYLSLIIGKRNILFYSYQKALCKFAQITSLSHQVFSQALDTHSIPYSSSWSEQELMHLVWSEVIEPQFNPDEFTVVYDFPASEAALAQIEEADGQKVAKRFEIYCSGYELANGYKELLDSNEQLKRFQKENHKRMEIGKESFSIDPEFIEALKMGLPPCCGVAVGFDRLLMIACKEDNIHHVIF